MAELLLPRAPRAAVFDMDGLLFDTETLAREAAEEACRALGRAPMADALYLRLIGHAWPANRELLLREWGDAAEVDALQGAWGRAFGDLAEARGIPLKPGAREALDLCDELRLPRAIATSSGPEAVRRNLLRNGLAGRFDAAVALGDYARPKPAPDPYLAAAGRLGVAPALCLALEDSPTGARAAAAAGMAVVVVPDLLHPPGEVLALCAGVARDLHEVAAALRAAFAGG